MPRRRAEAAVLDMTMTRIAGALHEPATSVGAPELGPRHGRRRRYGRYAPAQAARAPRGLDPVCAQAPGHATFAYRWLESAGAPCSRLPGRCWQMELIAPVLAGIRARQCQETDGSRVSR